MEKYIEEIVERYDNNITLKNEQMKAFVHLKERKGDLIINLPVGFGKSLIYHLLPEVLGSGTDKPVVVVVSPLNIIQQDQLVSLRDHGISACRLDIKGNVTEDLDDDDTQYTLNSNANITDVKRGRYSVVLCHPEAILNTSQGRELLDDEEFKDHVVAVVVDECHIIEKWGEEFRTAFKKLGSLHAFFPDVPLVALSGTLTLDQKQQLPKLLCMQDPTTIEGSPDRPNIFLRKIQKPPSVDVLSSYEDIFEKESQTLFELKELYPVTLMFLPVFYISEALMFLQDLFGNHTIEDSIYSALCSGQDEHVIAKTVMELRKENPKVGLVLTTSIAGMGFDPRNVTCVIHACPPRNLSQYLQEIGRTGRRGQTSEAIMYYSNRDIARHLPGIKDDIVNYCKNESSCLRENMLAVFGFAKDDTVYVAAGHQCCSFCVDHE